MNSERFLPFNLRKLILQQNCIEQIEVVFVDGMSTDETLRIISDFVSNSGFDAQLYEKYPKGVSDAMNFGSEMARGKYILFSHSDDQLYSSETISDLITILINENSPWIIGNCAYINEFGDVTDEPSTPAYSLKRLVRENFIPHPSVVMDNKVLQNLGGFSDSYKIAMDYHLWLRMSASYVPLQVPITISKFRIHDTGLSSKFRNRALQESHMARKENFDGLFFLTIEAANYWWIRFRLNVNFAKLRLVVSKVFTSS